MSTRFSDDVVIAAEADPALTDALARDTAQAGRLLASLRKTRPNHPGLPTLQQFVEAERAQACLVALASIAFEAAVRFHWGAVAGQAVMESGTTEEVGDLLVERDPMPWEPEENLAHPYQEVDWRRAVAQAGAGLASGDFAVPEAVPGAALIAAFTTSASRPDDAIDTLLGDAPRNEVLDPIVVQGSFLAQALPGFVDLDMALRQCRVRTIEDAATAKGQDTPPVMHRG